MRVKKCIKSEELIANAIKINQTDINNFFLVSVTDYIKSLCDHKV